AADVPTHHFIGDFVDLARRFAHLGVTPLVLGHDLLSAYRRWAVKRPVLLRHFLLLAVGHYVDDFNALDFPDAAEEARAAFSDLFSLGPENQAFEGAAAELCAHGPGGPLRGH
ncbi:unnamed protein product, partial [Symbiodinium natans]